MRAVAKPDYDFLTVYQTCINSISDVSLRSRLDLVSNDIVDAARDYEQKAEAKLLYTIISSKCGNDEIALGSVTKKELKDVYSSHMVGGGKPAREFYDKLLSQARLCPFCGFTEADTLDHYLPKAKYPQLSVLPINLVPSCTKCNKGKHAAIAITAEEQSLHPYFDHQHFINEQWLYAEILPTNPMTPHYFVRAPAHWDSISKSRVQSHFDNFNLAYRYAIQASDELAGKKYSLDSYKKENGTDALVRLLQNDAKSHAKNHINSWQTALYQALASKKWDYEENSVSEENYLVVSPLKTCPRCLGRGQLAGATCDACDGAGAAIQSHFDSLGESIYDPVSCSSCITGRLDCTLCKGKGNIPWKKAIELG
jgi:hypothetical protein